MIAVTFWIWALPTQNTLGLIKCLCRALFLKELIGVLAILAGECYPEATVTHLPRTFSDHCPVLLDLLGSKPESTNRPFRFHTMWLLHPQFPKVVEEAWAGERPFLPAISDFTVKVKKWNFEVF